ncbi:hypothetical protein IFM89_030785 [Coptis chinensis]|uniref:Protein kinase domain-containing protein n=1 Tax=Coptis chinensis TaxID=261450 RepID=A0A835MAF8_9MAGN|nr:hypothetical protein IFM89_030785 [Coptis chinensis]
MMVEGPKFPGIIGNANNGNNFYDFTQGFYQKLGEGSNMSIDSMGSMQTSNGGGSISMSVDNSSVGSNDSHTHILNHPGLRPVNNNNSIGHSVRPGRVSHALSDDALAQALMDNRFPTEGLEDYDDWTIDLRKLNMGMAFAQGAFGKLYKGTYNGEDGGSVRQFLMRRQNRSIPLKIAVKQALDVARGMAYVHGLGFIHRDLKSDNLLIFADKSIKIADFGVARIEVQTEGMTPETGTYRWMAPVYPTHGYKEYLPYVYGTALISISVKL